MRLKELRHTIMPAVASGRERKARLPFKPGGTVPYPFSPVSLGFIAELIEVT